MLLFLSLLFACGSEPPPADATTRPPERWTAERANAWYAEQPWLVGANFNPSTAGNQLEFWQAETFDAETIDRELGWSAELGMNLHRVYLHNLLWDQDSSGFLARVDTFLNLAAGHGIKTMLVLLDDVWHPVPRLGPQPEPTPHLHNSQWVQAPGAPILGDSSRHDELQPYIQGVIRRFADDDRVLVWDLYNEPGNRAGQEDRRELEVEDKDRYSLALLRKVFAWAREVDPSQPLTVGIWRGHTDHWGDLDSLPALDAYQLAHSDVISFHAYDDQPEKVQRKIDELRVYGRPLLCTEYLARTNNNYFANVLPVLQENDVAAINWGFVAGRSNTIYPWASWDSTFTAEPEIWFHDVLRPDGSPYDSTEVALLKDLTGGAQTSF